MPVLLNDTICHMRTHLHEFIGTNRDELIARCRAKVAGRSTSSAAAAEINHGVPLFLDQLVAELRGGQSKTREIAEGAAMHGADLLRQGFTVSQVVHDYGDVCQSVTDLAVEVDASLETEDFRTLNRCLDDAIAGAITEHARGEAVVRAGKSQRLQTLTNTAIAAFEAIKAGRVGTSGTTGAVLHSSLMALRALTAVSPRLATPAAPPAGPVP